MWYFILRQDAMSNEQYQRLQKIASLTEVEIFNEPYDNMCVFELETAQYSAAVDYLDLEGLKYEATTKRPTRDALLEQMR